MAVASPTTLVLVTSPLTALTTMAGPTVVEKEVEPAELVMVRVRVMVVVRVVWVQPAPQGPPVELGGLVLGSLVCLDEGGGWELVMGRVGMCVGLCLRWRVEMAGRGEIGGRGEKLKGKRKGRGGRKAGETRGGKGEREVDSQPKRERERQRKKQRNKRGSTEKGKRMKRREKEEIVLVNVQGEPPAPPGPYPPGPPAHTLPFHSQPVTVYAPPDQVRVH